MIHRHLRFCNLLCLAVIVFMASLSIGRAADSSAPFDLTAIEHDRVMKLAEQFLNDEPTTVTASTSSRSSGGTHDFYSEGDYWWPDPKNPAGPYIQRDGMTNPDNFVEHRHAMIRFSVHVGALASAYLETHDEKYARAAIKHMLAWFVDEPTRMNPNLQYAQAIKGVSTGRGIGIIDTVHLIEVARAAQILEQSARSKAPSSTASKPGFAITYSGC